MNFHGLSWKPDRQKGKQRQKYSLTYRQTEGQTYLQKDKPKAGQTERRRDRRTNRKEDGLINRELRNHRGRIFASSYTIIKKEMGEKYI